MHSRKRPAASAAAVAAGGKVSRGGNRVVVMLEGSERAVMPKQPTAIRKNACWAPPVVAIAGYYKFDTLPDAPRSKPERVSKSCRKWPEGTGQGGATITVESVLSLRPGDHPEVTCEVLEDITGHYLPGQTWSNEEDVKEDERVQYGGVTSICHFGLWTVAGAWWKALETTLGETGNPVLLLVERLEGKQDRGQTHFLLVLGLEELRSRRTVVRRLLLKDPMVGDALLKAELWALREAGGEPAELTTMEETKQGESKPLDRYKILEATHLEAPAEWQRRLQEDNRKEAPGGKRVEEEEEQQQEEEEQASSEKATALDESSAAAGTEMRQDKPTP